MRSRNIPSLYSWDVHHERCFACGVKNPKSLGISCEFNPKTRQVDFWYRIEEEHEGAPNHSHGGVIATLLDEAQGVLLHHLGFVVMTDTIHIEYKKRIPLFSEIHILAWFSAKRKKRLYTKAKVENKKGEILAISWAKWFLLSEKLVYRFFKEESFPRVFHEILMRNREERWNKKT